MVGVEAKLDAATRCNLRKYEVLLPLASLAPDLDSGWSVVAKLGSMLTSKIEPVFDLDAASGGGSWEILTVTGLAVGHEGIRELQKGRARSDKKNEPPHDSDVASAPIDSNGGGVAVAVRSRQGRDGGNPRCIFARTPCDFVLHGTSCLEWSTLLVDFDFSPEVRLALCIDDAWCVCRLVKALFFQKKKV